MRNEKIEWMWRMDDDSYLHSQITYHMFSFMAVNKFAYAFRQMVVDVTDGFAEASSRDVVDRGRRLAVHLSSPPWPELFPHVHGMATG